MLTNTSPTSSRGISTSTQTQMPPSLITGRLEQTRPTPLPRKTGVNSPSTPSFSTSSQMVTQKTTTSSALSSKTTQARSTSVLAATSAASSYVSTISKEWVYAPSISLALPSSTCSGKLTVRPLSSSAPPSPLPDLLARANYTHLPPLAAHRPLIPP